jgi:hypothetical protein
MSITTVTPLRETFIPFDHRARGTAKKSRPADARAMEEQLGTENWLVLPNPTVRRDSNDL